MRQYPVCPLPTRFIKIAHQLRHCYTLWVQAKVRDSFEVACTEDQLLLLLGRVEVILNYRILVFGNNPVFQHLGLYSKTLGFDLEE